MLKSAIKKEIVPVIAASIIFLVVYGLAIALVDSFITEGGVEPAFEEENNPLNIIYIVVAMLIVTFIILFIAKSRKERYIQILILGAIGYTSFFSFFLPAFNIILKDNYNLIFIISMLCAIILVILIYKYPEWYVLDLSAIIVGVGAIIIFGISLGILLIIVLLIALSIYDAISVYKTKHMIDLADTVMDLKLPVLLVIPKVRHYSLMKETKRLKEKLDKKEERDAFFIGLGDIVIPGMLVLAAHLKVGFLVAISIIIGILVGFLVLMMFVIKGKPQPGLPALCSGAIAGYIISSLILFGELKGILLPF